ncbi:ATP-binding protein [Streptomyces halstedii]|uniref:ATP-binding protein n=1 Tax=Streptomyces halstedii TaxID=1944 RepID=UPI0037D68607
MSVLGESQRVLEVKTWSWTQNPGSIPLSRVMFRKWLASIEATRFEEDATLCFSELLTNAIRIPSPDALTQTVWLLYDDRLKVEVWDYSTEAPYVAVRDPECESGKGLLLVHLLADRWGYDHTTLFDGNSGTAPGKRVWFELNN